MIRVQTIRQGAAVLAETAYDVKMGTDVVAFVVDAWGDTGRAYPAGSFGSCVQNIPSILFESGETSDEEIFTEVCFPDFPEWDVHCVNGGKTVAVCLTRRF